jgi:hypothetical protein
MYGVARWVSQTLQEFFPFIWLAVLALAVIWALSRRVPATASGPTVTPRIPNAIDHMALAAFAILTAFYVFVICYRVDFGDIDQSIYLWSMILKEGVNLPIWPGSGRFFPFGHQEFNFLRHLADPLKGFFVLSVLELLALLAVLYLLLDEFRIAARSLILALVLAAWSIYIAFSGLIYTERNLLLLIAVIAVCIKRYYRRPSVWPLAAALAATQLALYHKEPVFLFVIGFAAIPILRTWLAPPEGPRSIRRALAAHPIEVGMLVLSLVFIVMYAGIMLPHRSAGYAENHPNKSSPAAAFIWFLRGDPILVVFFLTLAYRVIRLVTRREELDPFWDGLAVGGALYFGAYVILSMESSYYTSPLDLIGILWVAELARRAVARGGLRVALPVGLAIIVAIPLAASLWYTAIRRKYFVHGKVAIAEFVRRTADTSAAPLRVFVPRQGPYFLMEFGALLMYRGVTVVPESLAAGRAGVVIIQGKADFPGGRCASHRVVACSHADEAARGSLVLTFPEDRVTSGQGVTLRPAGVPEFVYQPFAIPRVMPWLKRVRTTLQGPEPTQRSDWLWGYVVVANGEGR